jgi:hypothetical protein
MTLLLAFVTIALLPAAPPSVDATFVTVDGETYGAQPDDVGPIGGGPGYTRIVTKGDFTAKTLDELLDALGKAKSGQIIFIPGDAVIDCTARVYIEKLVLEIPEGVTLASDRGHEGSPGGLITSDALETKPLFRTTGPDARVTGLRIQGPNSKRYLDHHHRSFAEGRGHEYYYKFPISDGIFTEHDGLEVDNCELTAFSHSAVFLTRGTGHHIHHCTIHHCQYAGLGYGVCHDVASSLIERNRFDANRHSIAGTGRPGCGYEARHNVELGTSLSHCFDMHGGRDRKDGTDIAGTTITIHHNTFRAPETPVVIRGVPDDACKVSRNWFPRHPDPGHAVIGSDRTFVEENAYGADPPKVIR